MSPLQPPPALCLQLGGGKLLLGGRSAWIPTRCSPRVAEAGMTDRSSHMVDDRLFWKPRWTETRAQTEGMLPEALDFKGLLLPEVDTAL